MRPRSRLLPRRLRNWSWWCKDLNAFTKIGMDVGVMACTLAADGVTVEDDQSSPDKRSESEDEDVAELYLVRARSMLSV